ncbi:DUF4349 domain-containing protein [Flavobacterium johnsoniae]|jgi:hypothetical protein|uniref:Hypothetical lipoprotein n=1 Tax=Flavobacterium johnsoniae (strain ATCC 17061 / DSM 2064 / JCM 8514 / BCRC 14874 / CCUG 350202 / NBRC 14942 / NCIMB 11054 / UW101) TaxID=376686 RepID=A5FLB3_FLAJ1|nr:DUF4349 domain-containing protein [Flavobacterium johnsoniae]ABQ04004.1 hypothetical lipoprotein [Flavobacterium johnsoniae UW101]OXE96125.1 hypothetical protein B0A63_21645 [Flavobacterium johnsoniae UW101]WQG79125.1 DUF4349 domain-containing protein [Flavobacterium johnsoniae UW101]SHK09484.1 protein of unknown function [Flavobacterium johnsoniae]
MRNIFFLSVFFLIFSGCSKSNEPQNESMMISAVKLPAKANVNANVNAESDSYDRNPDLSAPKIEQKIIKEATLRFETDDLENTFNQIQKAVTAGKATIINDSEGKDYGTVFRNLTVKVPSQNFDRFINDISKGVSYFEIKNISAQDVTEQFIDLTSRLNTKKKLEERYLQILQKAVKVSEILEIEKQISVIREEIEAKEGQLKYLQSRVSESTVTIEFYKTTAEKEGVKISYGSKIWTAVKSGFFSLSDFLISLISVWPFIIIFCVLAYFIRKRFKRKKQQS